MTCLVLPGFCHYTPLVTNYICQRDKVFLDRHIGGKTDRTGWFGGPYLAHGPPVGLCRDALVKSSLERKNQNSVKTLQLWLVLPGLSQLVGFKKAFEVQEHFKAAVNKWEEFWRWCRTWSSHHGGRRSVYEQLKKKKKKTQILPKIQSLHNSGPQPPGHRPASVWCFFLL